MSSEISLNDRKYTLTHALAPRPEPRRRRALASVLSNNEAVFQIFNQNLGFGKSTLLMMKTFPPEGGVLFITWHPSGLIDPMLMDGYASR